MMRSKTKKQLAPKNRKFCEHSSEHAHSKNKMQINNAKQYEMIIADNYTYIKRSAFCIKVV